jgi:hypothetical protein
MTSLYDDGSGKSMPEQMLDMAEEAMEYTGLGDKFKEAHADISALTAMTATIGIILAEIENSACDCDVCDTLRQLELQARRL